MKHREIQQIGRINANGQLSLYMEQVKDFCKKFPNTRCILTIQVLDESESKAMEAYYYNYIIPTIQRAMYELGERMTAQQTADFLQEQSPMLNFSKWENGKYTAYSKKPEEVGNARFSEHIEWVKLYAAENLYTIIEEPTK